MSRFQLTQGDSASLAFTVHDGDGLPFDLGQADVFWAAAGDGHAITKSLSGGWIEVPVPASGAGTVLIAASDTDSWSDSAHSLVWSLVVTTLDGDVFTVSEGSLVVLPRAPLGSGTCVLSGWIYDATGTPIKNARVRVRLAGMGGHVSPALVGGPIIRPSTVVISGAITVASQTTAVYTDEDGAWSVTLPQGAIFFIEIPVADVRHYGVVPATSTSTLGALLPALQRWGG